MNNPPVVAMMMAMDKNRLIGSNGKLPWHIPGELPYFKQVTMGKPVIMGRKTYESIGKPLAGRTNIIVTRNTAWKADGVVVAGSLEQALEKARDSATATATATANKTGSKTANNATTPPEQKNELMIIGGAGLCRDAMPITQRLYLTTVDKEYEGDTWLDSFHWDEWSAVSEDVRDPATTGGLAVTYWVLERVDADHQQSDQEQSTQ